MYMYRCSFLCSCLPALTSNSQETTLSIYSFYLMKFFCKLQSTSPHELHVCSTCALSNGEDNSSNKSTFAHHREKDVLDCETISKDS